MRKTFQWTPACGQHCGKGGKHCPTCHALTRDKAH